ncbi:MAG: 50S ribosomal protein L23 [Deltaproteobacteria bacterium]|nr:50S ribosomal protein L23 [Deltaproteobacteria bacterium]MDL1961648.1 50S ribosomal protein L23 [Deltaproteobacteria bacterium]
MKELYSVIKAPLITEKATLQKEMANQLTFKVDRKANKIEIKNAVEKIFKVKVLSVRTIKVKGKPKRVGRFTGKCSGFKKAIVRLYPGESIEFFEGV